MAKQPSIWIVSDTHFGHDAMQELCHRPANFSNLIIDNWNRLVDHHDIVIHLGDVSWDSKDTWMGMLNGRKIHVKGNHDKKSYMWYMKNGFAFSCETFTIDYYGLDIVFSHKPLIFHEHDINIHGHLHDCASIESVCPHYLISLELQGYMPQKLSSILQKISVKLDNKIKEEEVDYEN